MGSGLLRDEPNCRYLWLKECLAPRAVIFLTNHPILVAASIKLNMLCFACADTSDVHEFTIQVLATNDAPVARLECPENMLWPLYNTLECSAECKGR